MVELVVTNKAGPDVIAQSIEQGLILSRANVTCRWGPGGEAWGSERRGAGFEQGVGARRGCWREARGCRAGAHGRVGVLEVHTKVIGRARARCSALLSGRREVRRAGAVHDSPPPPPAPRRRQGELIRGRAAMLSVITGKDWRDIGGRPAAGREGGWQRGSGPRGPGSAAPGVGARQLPRPRLTTPVPPPLLPPPCETRPAPQTGPSTTASTSWPSPSSAPPTRCSTSSGWRRAAAGAGRGARALGT
jgi:hypothetical protein